MLKLYGFPLSNYYNRVKIVLLEKGVAFEEVLAYPGKDALLAEQSPVGKIPLLDVGGQYLCESAAINEYLEEAYPSPALLPKAPLERARVRELTQVIDLHLELVSRRLYAEAFFGGKVSDETKKEVERDLRRGVGAFTKLARFDPYIAGGQFTLADCSAAVHLPLVSIATKIIYGSDALQELADKIKPYLKLCGERPSVARASADRKAAQEALAKK